MKDRCESSFRRLLWWGSVAILRVAFRWSSRIKVVGDVHQTAVPGPVLMVSNHISHFDPPLIASVLPRAIDWVAMDELMPNALARAFFRSYNTIPIRRGSPDRSALKLAVDRLQGNGRLVGIFPEGGLRHDQGSLLKGAKPHRGVELIARMARCPVLPAAVIGTDRLYNRAYWLSERKAAIWVGIGEVINPPNGKDPEWLGTVAAQIEELGRRFSEEGGAATEDFPQSPQARMAERFGADHGGDA